MHNSCRHSNLSNWCVLEYTDLKFDLEFWWQKCIEHCSFWGAHRFQKNTLNAIRERAVKRLREYIGVYNFVLPFIRWVTLCNTVSSDGSGGLSCPALVQFSFLYLLTVLTCLPRCFCFRDGWNTVPKFILVLLVYDVWYVVRRSVSFYDTDIFTLYTPTFWEKVCAHLLPKFYLFVLMFTGTVNLAVFWKKKKKIHIEESRPVMKKKSVTLIIH